METLDHIVYLHQINGNQQSSSSSDKLSYIDAFLNHNQNDETEENLKTNSGRKKLIASLTDILLGGEGIIFGLYSLLYCLAKHPIVQQKMRDEIKLVTLR